jgi:hypothetical protein
MSRDESSLIVKDPASLEPYGFDWTEWLLELGASVTITTSTWAVTKGGGTLALSDDSIIVGARKTQVKLNGGLAGKTYLVTNSILTTSGDEDERSFKVLVQNR